MFESLVTRRQSGDGGHTGVGAGALELGAEHRRGSGSVQPVAGIAALGCQRGAQGLERCEVGGVAYPELADELGVGTARTTHGVVCCTTTRLTGPQAVERGIRVDAACGLRRRCRIARGPRRAAVRGVGRVGRDAELV
jgi:hypothetical protein